MVRRSAVSDIPATLEAVAPGGRRRGIRPSTPGRAAVSYPLKASPGQGSCIIKDRTPLYRLKFSDSDIFTVVKINAPGVRRWCVAGFPFTPNCIGNKEDTRSDAPDSKNSSLKFDLRHECCKLRFVDRLDQMAIEARLDGP